MQRVVVTGGTRGIGLEIVKLFIAAEFEVFVVGRDFSAFPRELKSKSKQIIFDLQYVNKIPKLAQQIGDIDILVNNAGVSSLLEHNHNEDKKNTMIKVNLEAPIALISEFSRGMIKIGKGRIVSVASISGEIGSSDIWYGVTKAGIINATKSFAKLLGKNGVVVNCVAPSMVEATNMFDVIPVGRKVAQRKRLLTNDFVKPKSVAETVFWLATKSPPYINGICIDINNGLLMR